MKAMLKDILPSWIDPDLWKQFMAMRKELGAKNTPRAKTRLINRLGRFRDAGHDPMECLRRSLDKDWRDVYEPQDTPRQQGQRLAGTAAFRAYERKQEPSSREVELSRLQRNQAIADIRRSLGRF